MKSIAFLETAKLSSVNFTLFEKMIINKLFKRIIIKRSYKANITAMIEDIGAKNVFHVVLKYVLGGFQRSRIVNLSNRHFCNVIDHFFCQYLFHLLHIIINDHLLPLILLCYLNDEFYSSSSIFFIS